MTPPRYGQKCGKLKKIKFLHTWIIIDMLKPFFKVLNNIEIVLPHSPQVSGQILLIESNQPVILLSEQLYFCFQRGHFRRWSGLSWQSKDDVKTEDAESAECYSSKAARLLYLIWNLRSTFHYYNLVWGCPGIHHFFCICSIFHQ